MAHLGIVVNNADELQHIYYFLSNYHEKKANIETVKKVLANSIKIKAVDDPRRQALLYMLVVIAEHGTFYNKRRRPYSLRGLSEEKIREHLTSINKDFGLNLSEDEISTYAEHLYTNSENYRSFFGRGLLTLEMDNELVVSRRNIHGIKSFFVIEGRIPNEKKLTEDIIGKWIYEMMRSHNRKGGDHQMIASFDENGNIVIIEFRGTKSAGVVDVRPWSDVASKEKTLYGPRWYNRVYIRPPVEETENLMYSSWGRLLESSRIFTVR